MMRMIGQKLLTIVPVNHKQFSPTKVHFMETIKLPCQMIMVTL